MDLLSPETLNIIYLIIAIGIGWTILRFIFRLVKRIFAFGCFTILAIGMVLVLLQFLQGGL